MNKEANVKGHLIQERKNLRSTKLNQNSNTAQEATENHNKEAYITIEAATPQMLCKNKNYSNLTGKFPQK